MSSTFYTDNAIEDKRRDEFDRTAFSEQIAKICIGNTSQSLVIGIYGKWGEGKTSLLNMVCQSLPEATVKIKFNPWFFKDESDLFNSFFKAIASSLDKAIPTQKERILKVLGDYKDTIGIVEEVPKIGFGVKLIKSVTTFFKGYKPITVDIAKKRVEDFIIESEKNIVIFIDDIDRLDVREIESVFKMVKLLADFPRTTYILSFDIDLVADMLAPQYGVNVPRAGYKFIEKIIQVPLTLPKARNAALKDYILNIIGSSYNLGLIKDKRFEPAFIDGIIPLLSNPRKAQRLSNAIRFGLPLVEDSINPCDFILMEGIRASFPDFYSFMHENKDIFLEDYSDLDFQRGDSKRATAHKKVQEEIEKYNAQIQEIIRTLICTMFPRFVWVQPYSMTSEKAEDWLIQKRICSRQYIDMYFSYALPKGDIPDRHFNQTYINIEDKTLDKLVSEIRADFKQYSVDDIVFKLVYYRHTILDNAASKLAIALSQVSNSYKQKEAFDFGNSFQLAALTVHSLVQNLPERNRINTAKQVITDSESIYFAAEMIARFVMPESENKPETTFNGLEAKELKSIYVTRARQLIHQFGFFDAIGEDNMLRLLIWWNDVDRESLTNEISMALTTDKTASLKLLRIFTPTIYSTSTSYDGIKRFKSNFSEEVFNRIESIIGRMKIYYSLFLYYGDKSNLAKIASVDINDELDDEMLIGLFQKMYNEKDGRTLGASH